MKWIIKENTHLERDVLDFGWGNGYVLLPKNHPDYGKDYSQIDVEVHRGLTFSSEITEKMCPIWDLPIEDVGMWMVGFDTFHSGDTLQNRPKCWVEEETKQLFKQLAGKINDDILDATVIV